MHWLKKNFEKWVRLINGEEHATQRMSANTAPPSGHTTSPVKNKTDNIEELKEITIGAITQSVRMLGHSSTVVSGLRLHSKFAAGAVENVGLVALISDEDFIKRIKRDFKSKGILYKNDFEIDIVHESDTLAKVTAINNATGVEVLTPQQTMEKIKAQLKATEGITWQEVYQLEPTGKQYFIGRCKNPKIDNGPKIHNDIAFVGKEEKDEPKYDINNYVSRSHAMIVFDKDTGTYKLYRSRFLNNPSHKIKIYNTVNDYKEVSLTQSKVPHTLQQGDNICLNDKVVLEFTLINE